MNISPSTAEVFRTESVMKDTVFLVRSKDNRYYFLGKLYDDTGLLLGDDYESGAFVREDKAVRFDTRRSAEDGIMNWLRLDRTQQLDALSWEYKYEIVSKVEPKIKSNIAD